MDKELEIMNEIERLEKMHEKRKSKRNKKAIAIITIVFYLINTFVFGIEKPLDYLINIPEAFIAALIYFFVSAIVFGLLDSASESERDCIRRLKYDLETIRKEKAKRQYF